ncbi:MAG: ankyrin repeat domain-containing protein [Puniceicoccales bacterium]|jgi:ankyrin repeat protein|nr:ankyrin repeat domain-containing protein [Puniceicoccales bacterium]
MERGWNGEPYIHYLCLLVVAIRSGNIDIVHLLLKRGANVNPGQGTTNVPFYEAVKKGRSNIVRLLLEQKGIDVNAYQNVGMN